MRKAPNSPRMRIAAVTGLHRGDRAYQQDQVLLMAHPRVEGCALAVVADGMGGKSGGRKAADQVMLTSRQVFERFVPAQDSPAAALLEMARDANLMIKLTAIAAEEEPHSTIAAFLLMPDRTAHVLHAGDSRVYHIRNGEVHWRTRDHSYVETLVQSGELNEAEAESHPKSNLLVGCLGTHQDPPYTQHTLSGLLDGDVLMACSDGLWHYFTPHELATILQALPARQASEMLLERARQRARGTGDNLSWAIVRLESIAPPVPPASPPGAGPASGARP